MASLLDLVTQLLAERQPRPDLITPGSMGEGLQMPRPATFAGRLMLGPESPQDVLKRLPTESPEGEGMQGLGQGVATALMAKQFKPGPQVFAEFAKEGTSPLSSSSKLWPAWGNPKTGEVMHAMQPIAAGWHEPNSPMKLVGKTLVPDPGWLRGHVDPLTFKFFDEGASSRAYERFKLP